MRKRKIIGVCLCFFIIFSMLILGYVFAKYSNNIISRKVLKWSFNSPNETSSINLSEEKIMPGKSGSFDIEIDATDSETKINFKVLVLKENNIPSNLRFSAQIKNEFGEIEVQTEEYESFSKLAEEKLNGDIDIQKNNQKRIITIFWNWDFEQIEDLSNKKKDENSEILDCSFDIEIIGNQI